MSSCGESGNGTDCAPLSPFSIKALALLLTPVSATPPSVAITTPLPSPRSTNFTFLPTRILSKVQRHSSLRNVGGSGLHLATTNVMGKLSKSGNNSSNTLTTSASSMVISTSDNFSSTIEGKNKEKHFFLDSTETSLMLKDSFSIEENTFVSSLEPIENVNNKTDKNTKSDKI